MASSSITLAWQKRDKGLVARMILSFGILTLLYLTFLSILAYVGIGFIPITLIVSLMILGQFYFSDKIVLWSSGAKIVTRDQHPELHDLVERIVARNNMPKPKIAVMNTSMPNAFAVGRSPMSSVVCVTTGLLKLLEPEELEAVIGHELTHIRNRDVMVLTLAGLISTVAWYMMQFSFYGGLGYGYGTRSRNSGAGTMAIIIVVSLVTWLVSFLIIRAISRYREFAADRGGAQMTGKPAVLASALMKISSNIKKIPARDLRQAEGLNAFFIIPALSRSSIANLFSTHPTVEKRIEMLMKMEMSMS
jgi:heat shock protein HtpX